MTTHTPNLHQAALHEAARAVLLCADPDEKAKRAMKTAHQWQAGQLIRNTVAPKNWPTQPARPSNLVVLSPNKMPKRGTGGGKAHISLLHALAHIELNAIDLAFDLIGRFAHHDLPDRFISDWVQIGADEGKHFSMLNKRLREFDTQYGDRPVHDGLWEAARATEHDLAARLAIVPLVLEARGLDVTPPMIRKLKQHGDRQSAAILETIYEDEKAHVNAGIRWFMTLCRQQKLDAESHFKQLVARHFNGHIKPPFNIEARTEAGLPVQFYTQPN